MLIKYTRLTALWSSVFTYRLRRVCTLRWNWNNPCSASLVEYEQHYRPNYLLCPAISVVCFKFTHLRCCVLSYALRTFFSFQDGRGVNKKYDAFAYRGISDELHINQTKKCVNLQEWFVAPNYGCCKNEYNAWHYKKNRIVFLPDLVHVNFH